MQCKNRSLDFVMSSVLGSQLGVCFGPPSLCDLHAVLNCSASQPLNTNQAAIKIPKSVAGKTN